MSFFKQSNGLRAILSTILLRHPTDLIEHPLQLPEARQLDASRWVSVSLVFVSLKFMTMSLENLMFYLIIFGLACKTSVA